MRTLIFALFFFSSVLAHARDYYLPGTVGEGKYVHQFVLRDPVSGKPMPTARYRLFLPGQVISGVTPTDTDSVIFGVTDSHGRTVTVRMAAKYPEKKWILDQIIGEGDYGEVFKISSYEHKPVAKFDYLIDVADSYLFCGRTGPAGNTYYVQSRQARKLSLLQGSMLTKNDFAWCRHTTEIIARQVTASTAADVLPLMWKSFRTEKNSLSPNFRKQVQEKLLDLAISTHSEGEVTRVLNLYTNEDPLDADDYNTIGWKLVKASFMLERAIALFDMGLEKDPAHANTMDSKGWALFRLGRTEDALQWVERSLTTLATKPDLHQGANGTAAEIWAHKGELLWQLGRKEEARSAFAKADSLDSNNEVLIETRKRLIPPENQ